MILYDLKCIHDHQFEAWFKDSGTYDKQAAAGEVACPFCGDVRVRKAPMAPRLSKGLGSTKPESEGERRAREVARQILDAVSKLKKQVEDTFEYVGDGFAEEARAIHHGEAEQRPIYGDASEEEVRELDEEGVPVVRLPGISKADS